MTAPGAGLIWVGRTTFGDLISVRSALGSTTRVTANLSHGSGAVDAPPVPRAGTSCASRFGAAGGPDAIGSLGNEESKSFISSGIREHDWGCPLLRRFRQDGNAHGPLCGCGHSSASSTIEHSSRLSYKYTIRTTERIGIYGNPVKKMSYGCRRTPEARCNRESKRPRLFAQDALYSRTRGIEQLCWKQRTSHFRELVPRSRG